MGFLHRLGSALVHYGIIGSILVIAVLVGVLGYGGEEIMGELEGMMEDDYIQFENEDELSDFAFELTLLLAPLPVLLYRYFAIDRTGPVGEVLLFFLAGANPVLGLIGLILYAGTSSK